MRRRNGDAPYVTEDGVQHAVKPSDEPCWYGVRETGRICHSVPGPGSGEGTVDDEDVPPAVLAVLRGDA